MTLLVLQASSIAHLSPLVLVSGWNCPVMRLLTLIQVSSILITKNCSLSYQQVTVPCKNQNFNDAVARAGMFPDLNQLLEGLDMLSSLTWMIMLSLQTLDC